MAGLAVRAGRAARPAPGGRQDRRPLSSTNKITYDYDRKTNTYLRVGDAASRSRSTRRPASAWRPKNVIVMYVRFGPLNDGIQEAAARGRVIGPGTAYIATNGKTIKGTWRRTSVTAPTASSTPNGKPVTLTVGQTFIQVVPTGTKLTIKDGKVPPAAAALSAR